MARKKKELVTEATKKEFKPAFSKEKLEKIVAIAAIILLLLSASLVFGNVKLSKDKRNLNSTIVNLELQKKSLENQLVELRSQNSDELIEETDELKKQVTKLKNQIIKLKKEISDFQKKTGLDPQIFTWLTDCNFWVDKDFKVYKLKNLDPFGAGSATFNGKLEKITITAAYSDDPNIKVTVLFMRIKLQLKEPAKNFYDYFFNLVKIGNTINQVQGKDLLFRIGTLKSNELVSNSSISSAVKSQIINALNSKTTISLEFTVPQWPGFGIGDSFSYACKISK